MACKNCDCRKIEVRNSEIHGFGVFATKNIKKGEVIERCPLPSEFIQIEWYFDEESKQMNSGSLNILPNYRYAGPKPPHNKHHAFWVVPGGYAMFYNSSWPKIGMAKDSYQVKERLMIITALQDIKKGEEILMQYQTPKMMKDERNRNNKS